MNTQTTLFYPFYLGKKTKKNNGLPSGGRATQPPAHPGDLEEAGHTIISHRQRVQS